MAFVLVPFVSTTNSIGISFAVAVNPQIRIRNQQNSILQSPVELSSSCQPEIPPSTFGNTKEILGFA
jgi:hypothetical protein